MQSSKLSRIDPPVPVAELLGALSCDILRTLDAVRVPAYIVDSHRRVRWQNTASIDLVGDLRGRLDGSVGLSPADLEAARDAYRRKLNGATHTEVEVSVRRQDGTPVRVTVSSVPIRAADGGLIGSFGMVQVLGEVDPRSEAAPTLSRRERETLALLAAGYSTAEMAEEMTIATETVRNHVRRLLHRLGARSRVEAVAKGRRAGLI